MVEILVRLAASRNRAGTLIARRGAEALCGPFWVAGRAADGFASGCGNVQRPPTLPGGDTPLGRYRLIGIVSTGSGTPYDASSYGSQGLIAIEPIDGDAALAEANGRFVFFIQGCARSTPDLPATDGSLRLTDQNLAVLRSVLEREAGPVFVSCEQAQDADPGAPEVDGRAPYGASPADEVWARPSTRHHSAASPSPAPWRTPRFVAASVSASAIAHGEYDAGGTHTEPVDGMQVKVPDGSHVERREDGLHFVPDAPAPEPPQPVNPEPPQPEPPASSGPAEPHPPHDHPDPPDIVAMPAPTPIPASPNPISPERGRHVADVARTVAASYASRSVNYLRGGSAAGGGTTSDCSHFVNDVLTQAGIGSPFVTAHPGPGSIWSSEAFQAVTGHPQAGDIVVEQTDAGPTGWHMGVYLGQTNAAGAPLGLQMGRHGPGPMAWRDGPWGAPTYYRPVR